MIIAGPCVIETEAVMMATARHLADIGQRLGVEIIFKSSFDKANRSSGASRRGPGMADGLALLARVRAETGLRMLTDVHEAGQVDAVADQIDVLQIPAFLCRQTDLVTAAAASGRTVNIKKGQFLAPADMAHVVAKATGAGAPLERIWLTERGTSFGHHDLVVDFRGLAAMAATGCKVIFDATHSVQRPGGASGVSSGDRAYIPLLARAAAAAGVDGLFAETHPDPASAWSDPATAWPLDRFEALASDFLAHRALGAQRQTVD